MYKYFAKDKNGEVIKGQIDAPSREYATSMINSMGLYLISLDEEKKSFLKLPGRVNKKQISIILRQMSTMIKAAIPIPVNLPRRALYDGWYLGGLQPDDHDPGSVCNR